MIYKFCVHTFRLGILMCLMALPGIAMAQSAPTSIESLEKLVTQLETMIMQLKVNQPIVSNVGQMDDTSLTLQSTDELNATVDIFSKQNQTEIRIDAITQDLLKINQRLKDPQKRHALAKCRDKGEVPDKSLGPKVNPPRQVDQFIARSIDIAAMKFIRKGYSLDQARLQTIDQTSAADINQFYNNLPKGDRHKLYDIINEIMVSESVSLEVARRSALYYYLFAR